MKRSHQAAGRAVFAALVAIVSVALTASTAMAEGTLVAEPEEVDFGDVLTGQSAVQSMAIRNEGPDPVTIEDLYLYGDVDPFDFDGGTCDLDVLLGVDEACTVQIRFTAGATGEHQALLVAEGGPADDPAVGLLSAVSASLPQMLFPVPGFLDLPQVAANGRMSRGTVVYNRGGHPVTFGQPSITGIFRVSDDRCSGTVVSPGAWCHIRVDVGRTLPNIFAPDLPLGRHEGTLTVRAHGAASVDIPLSVEVTPPKPAPPPPSPSPPLEDPVVSAALKRALRPVARLIRGGPARGLRLASFDVGAQGILNLRLRARLGKRWVTIAAETSTVGTEGGERVPFALNRKGRRILSGRKPIKVQARLRFRAVDRGARYVETVAVTVKPRPARRPNAKRKPQGRRGGG